ncbi:MAG TPA: hypothetical protein PLG75_01175 [Methanoculleus sp.]|nr:hypothetical protein [Methanoculleus sp.]
MEEDDLPELPITVEEYIGVPYGGLFGDTVITHVVREIVADPEREFRTRYLAKMTGKSDVSVRDALEKLVDLNLLIKEYQDPQRPVYRVIPGSKRLDALTFLAYAVIDDREGTGCMRDAVFEYCRREVASRFARGGAEAHEPEKRASYSGASPRSFLRGSQVDAGQYAESRGG